MSTPRQCVPLIAHGHDENSLGLLRSGCSRNRNRNPMADSDEARLKAERIKAMLAGYYGASSTSAAAPSSSAPGPSGSASHPGPGPGPPPPRPNLDSPAFNAEQHISAMLRAQPLEKLLVEHRSMAREIKSLDSDMQQLVYENYNKFISATDTIRSMKGPVDGMGADMERLKSVMDHVSDKTNAVCDKLHKRNEAMEELQKVQSLLKKLQAVFDLPKKMRAALEGDMLDTAVSFFAEAQPLLHKYGNRGTFKQINAEANMVAKEIAQILKRRLTERKDSEEQCVLLLRKLGEPDDTLQDKYLQGRAHRLRRILREAGVVADAMAVAASAAAAGPPGPSAGPPAPGTVPLDALVSRGVEAPPSWGFVPAAAAAVGAAGAPSSPSPSSRAVHPPGIRQFVRLLDEKVINAMQETVVNMLRFFLQGEAQLPARRKALVSLAREVFNDYFKLVRRAVADASVVAIHRSALLAPGAEVTAAVAEMRGGAAGGAALFVSPEGRHLEFGSEWGAEGLVQALSTLSADLGLLHSHLPELSLKDRAAALVSGCIQRHLAAAFGAVGARVLAGLGAVRSRLEAPGGVGQEEQLLRKAYVYCSSVLQLGLGSVMEGLKPFDSPAAVRLMGPWRYGYADAVQGMLQRLFLSMVEQFMDMARMRYDGSDLVRAALRPTSGPLPPARPAPATPDPLTPDAPPGPDASAFSETSPALQLPGSSHYAAFLGPQQLPGSSPPAAAAASPQPQGDPKTALLLLLCKLSFYLEHSSVPWAMEALAASPALAQQQQLGPGGGPGGQGEGSLLPPAFVPGELARRLNAAGGAMLGVYVELHGRQLSLMMRRSVSSTQWLNHKEPRGPRPVCDLALERMVRAEAEVVQLVEETGRGRADERKAPGPRGPGPSSGLDAALALETTAVERNLAKIFKSSRGARAFGSSVPFTQSGILAAIGGVGVKSLVECVRLQTLGRQGLQQLQLDCHYLRPSLRRMTGGAGATAQVVDSLLDEVVSAGVERSLDPALLENPVLDRILDSSDSAA